MDDSSNMTEEWIANAIKANPCRMLESGNILTCPVRLSFPNIFARGKPVPPATEGKFGANLIFPPKADLSLIRAQMQQVTIEKWANAGKQGGPKLRSPLKSQSEMLATNYGAGYNADGFYLSCNSGRQPGCFDARQQPITDPDRVYSGVWAVATIKASTYDVGVNKGATFYLQAIMIVADDKPLAGGGSNPDDFAGIQLDASVSSDGVFGNDEDAAAAKLFS